VHRGLGRYEERETFAAWLMRILINECRTLSRRRARRERRIVLDDGAVERSVQPSAEASADLKDALQRSLDRLDPSQREAVLLKFGEGLDYAEIAALTGASVSALKMRVKRARDAMRPDWEER
jgi:RNA polymerase sigma-70 factor (ECF subfamily)